LPIPFPLHRASFLSLILSVGVFCAPAAALEDFQSTTKSGLAAMDEGKYDEAEKQLKKALLYSGSGPKYGDYSTGLLNLGNLFAKQKQFSMAENYYHEALQNYQKAFGSSSMEGANVDEALGDMYRKAGKFESAIPHYQKAKAVRMNSAKDHPMLAETLAGLAECKAKTGKKDEAIPLMQKVVSIREKAFGKLNGKVLQSRYALARLYDDMNKQDLAIAAYEKLIGDATNNIQKACPSMERLAVLYSLNGRYGEADEMFKKVLALREQRPGKANADLNQCVKLYSEFLTKRKRSAEAKALESRFAAKKTAK